MAKTPGELPPEVLAAFARRQPIEAIRLLLALRAQGRGAPASGTSARPQAADAAMRTASRAKAQRDKLSPGEVPRSGPSVWLLVVAALLAYLAYRLFGG